MIGHGFHISIKGLNFTERRVNISWDYLLHIDLAETTFYVFVGRFTVVKSYSFLSMSNKVPERAAASMCLSLIRRWRPTSSGCLACDSAPAQVF